MPQATALLHGAATGALIIAYLWLVRRFWRKPSEEETTTLEKGVAHFARAALLFVYVTGVLLTAVARRDVSPLHHYAALLPAAVLLVYRLLPVKSDNPYRGYAVLFAALTVAVVLTAVSIRWLMYPKL